MSERNSHKKDGKGTEELFYDIEKGSVLNLEGNFCLYSELSPDGDLIDHGYQDLNMWFYGEERFKGGMIWDGVPEGEIKKRFPFCRYVQLFCATGGEYAGYAYGQLNRDLLADPTDFTKGYNFAPLIKACENILRQGIKPYLKMGPVPISFSDDVEISLDFHTNKRPPRDWDQYYNYLKAIVEALAEKFGEEELKTWMWGSLTELDNASWFITADNKIENAANAAIKMYECTVAAVEAVLGEGQVDIGPHFSFCYWSPELLIKHCTEEINPFTGKKGTTIKRISVSFYQNTPDDANRPEIQVAPLEKWAKKYGFSNVYYSFDEGDVIKGPDGLNLKTTTYISQPWATSKRALDFKKALDNNWRSFFSWGYTTFGGGGTWNEGMFKSSNLKGPNLGSTNVCLLAYKLFGCVRQAVAKGGNLSNKNDIVDAVIGYSTEKGNLYILIFNHNFDFYEKTEEVFTIKLMNAQISGKSKAKKWRVDEDHADFFKTWWEERGKNARYEASVFDGTFPRALVNEEDKRFWAENEERYEKISTLGEPTEYELATEGRFLTIRDSIVNHGVILYEIDNVKVG